MKKIIVVADDFGFCTSVNDGCVEAYQQGAVRELSLMLKSPGTQDALEKAKKNSIKNIGLHCLLVFWEDRGTLARRDDYKKLFQELSKDNIINLFHYEVSLFEKVVGRKPSHITSHYQIHGHEKLRDAVLAYCHANNIPMRLPGAPILDTDNPPEEINQVELVRAKGCRSADVTGKFMSGSYEEVKAQIIQFVERVDVEHGEIMLHPGIVSDELRKLSSMVEDRERDLRISKWISAQYSELITDFSAV